MMAPPALAITASCQLSPQGRGLPDSDSLGPKGGIKKSWGEGLTLTWAGHCPCLGFSLLTRRTRNLER